MPLTFSTLILCFQVAAMNDRLSLKLVRGWVLGVCEIQFSTDYYFSSIDFYFGLIHTQYQSHRCLTV